MRRNITLAIILLIIAASLLGALVYSVLYFFFLPNNKMVPAFDETKLNLVVGGEVAEAKDSPRIIDNSVMLPLETVKKYFDPNIWWDETLGKLTITTRDKVIRMKTDSLNAYINDKPMDLKISATKIDGTLYVPVEFLSDLYKIDINYLKDSNVVIIDYKNSIKRTAEPIKPEAAVRKGRTIRYPILKKLDIKNGKPEDNVLTIFEEYDKWYKVRTAEGIIGYVEKRNVVVKEPVIAGQQQEEDNTPAWKPESGKINLAWEILEWKPTISKLSRAEGLDVLSPTWFQVANETGKPLINWADPAYVDWAHKNGYKVWALVRNDFQKPASTKALLNNTDARDNLIREVLAYAALYKLDGINIDFENINKEDKNALTQFVREITPFLREQGLVVSIDVGVPDGSDNYSLCYDTKALGQIVDYVAVMTYDQYWSTSPTAGPVAQASWVEKNLLKTLELVPKDKLLLGLPFYSRVWEEKPDKDGKMKLTVPAKSLTMDAAKKLIKENNAQAVWDEQSGLFYAEYKKDGANYRIWLEDENSIDLKSSLIQKYQLAGAASWSKTFEVPEVWNVLSRNLKQYHSYQDWLAASQQKKYVFN